MGLTTKPLKLASERIRKHKLYAKLLKCTFLVQEVDYLRSALQAVEHAMNPNNFMAIEVWETPNSKKELHSFLNLMHYYGRFICNW